MTKPVLAEIHVEDFAVRIIGSKRPFEPFSGSRDRNSERMMTNHVAKVIEVVGASDVSIDDAIKGAIARAAETIDDMQWFQVVETRGSIAGQKIERFQVILKIAFGIHE